MANIEFGDTPDQQLATLMLVVNGLHLTINGNGHPGLKFRAEQFMAEHEGAIKEQEKQHEDNTRRLERSNNKLNWLLVIATIIMAFTGIGMLIITLEVRNHASADPAKIFHSAIDDRVLSFTHKPSFDAANPNLHFQGR